MINCPKCASEALVETPALGNIPLDVCPNCSGIWFDAGELEALLGKSQGSASADFTLINPRPVDIKCARCGNKMSRGGLVNPLLLVDKCQSCGGTWLDPNELALVKKLLGLSGGPSEVKVDRPAAAQAAPEREGGSPLLKLVSAACAMLGLAGLSFEMYLYSIPEASVSRAPSAGLAAAGALFLAGGIFFLNRRK